jgi:hypothetical protein
MPSKLFRKFYELNEKLVSKEFRFCCGKGTFKKFIAVSVRSLAPSPSIVMYADSKGERGMLPNNLQFWICTKHCTVRLFFFFK